MDLLAQQRSRTPIYTNDNLEDLLEQCAARIFRQLQRPMLQTRWAFLGNHASRFILPRLPFFTRLSLVCITGSSSFKKVIDLYAFNVFQLLWLQLGVGVISLQVEQVDQVTYTTVFTTEFEARDKKLQMTQG